MSIDVQHLLDSNIFLTRLDHDCWPSWAEDNKTYLKHSLTSSHDRLSALSW